MPLDDSTRFYLKLLPIRWRYLLVALVPMAIAAPLVFFLGPWSILMSSLAGIALALSLSATQTRFFKGAIYSVLRMRSTDRGHRLEVNGRYEEARLAQAINRMAEGVEDAIESQRSRSDDHENILNQMSDGVMVVDARGLLRYSNNAARRILDFDILEEDVSSIQLASKVNIFDINDTAQKTMASQQVHRRMVELYNPLRYIEVLTAPLQPQENDGEGALLIVRDRTDEYRLAESMREFVANASHELRTPIAAIQASVDTLKLGALEDREAAEDFLDRISTSTEKMTRLVTDLMDLTLLESGRMSMHSAPVSPSELVKSVMEQFEPIATRSGINLHSQMPENLPLISLDKQQIERALENLVSNSLKFTPTGGTVTLRCDAKGSSFVFTVEDNGIGIDVDELPHIFERFYKTSQRSAQQDGFGLGLAIARNIVEMHQGRIKAESVLGQGSKFKIELPHG